MDVDFIDVGTLSAELQDSDTLSFELQSQSGIEFEISTPHVIDANVYDGKYEVTPKTYEQFLSTKDKLMMDDVKIKEIPYFETSNAEDGITVYIANTIA